MKEPKVAAWGGLSFAVSGHQVDESITICTCVDSLDRVHVLTLPSSISRRFRVFWQEWMVNESTLTPLLQNLNALNVRGWPEDLHGSFRRAVDSADDRRVSMSALVLRWGDRYPDFEPEALTLLEEGMEVYWETRDALAANLESLCRRRHFRFRSLAQQLASKVETFVISSPISVEDTSFPGTNARLDPVDAALRVGADDFLSLLYVEGDKIGGRRMMYASDLESGMDFQPEMEPGEERAAAAMEQGVQTQGNGLSSFMGFGAEARARRRLELLGLIPRPKPKARKGRTST